MFISHNDIVSPQVSYILITRGIFVTERRSVRPFSEGHKPEQRPGTSNDICITKTTPL
jgi:hypothetical protein